MTIPTTPAGGMRGDASTVSFTDRPAASADPTTHPTLLLGPGDLHDGFFLWGAPKAGKSGFIGALYGLSRGSDEERWTAHPKDCDDPHTQEAVLRAHEELSGRRNTKTGVRDTPYRPLRLTLRKMKHGRHVGELRVALVDPAGEFSVDPAYRVSSAGKALYRQVAMSHGILWLFEATPDGAAAALDRLLILEQLVALLEAGGGAQLDVPVAICLSKIDCLSEERRQAAVANPTQALLDHLGATSLTWFEAVCPTLGCFAISSAGAVPDKVRPIGLNEVLDWLEAQRARRIRAARVGRLRGHALGLLKRWGGAALKGTAMVALLGGFAYGSVRVVGNWRKSGVSADSTSPDSTSPDSTSPDSRSARRATAELVRAVPSPQVRRPRTIEPRSPVAGSATRAPVVPDVAPRAAGAGAAPRARSSRQPAGAQRQASGDVMASGRSASNRFDLQAARDSMRAAFDEGMALQRAGRPGTPWFRRAYVHASRILARGAAGSRAYTPERLMRARVCLIGQLDCPRAEVSEDLTWALVFGDDAQRRMAVRLLERVGG